jgi:hypothetical protein
MLRVHDQMMSIPLFGDPSCFGEGSLKLLTMVAVNAFEESQLRILPKLQFPPGVQQKPQLDLSSCEVLL